MIMREIGFRGLDVNGKWHVGLVSQSAGLAGQPSDGLYISNFVGSPFAFKIRKETLGQFTGLLDKNGKRIFEGDILEEEKGYFFYVVFDDRYAKFKLKHSEKAIQYPEWNRGVEMSVVGNIHEDKNLLKEG